tara:strand:+ start:94 stop:450 length:357 start_codon:yes stop_codon:yes gene_type:complete
VKTRKITKIPIDKKIGNSFWIITGIKYRKNKIKNRFILSIFNFSNNFEIFRSNILEIKDNEVTKHRITIAILVSNDSKRKEDKKITKEKFIAISKPSIKGRKSFKLKLICFLEVFIFV